MSNSGIGTPYWYEWEIGIIECLRMLFDDNIISVVLQSSEFQKLDDVVVNYRDGSITNIQVKHTDVDDNFTYSFLSSGKDSLLAGLANEWQNKKDSYKIREIQLVTNKKWGSSRCDGKCSMKDFVTIVYPKLKEDFSYDGQNAYEKAAVAWFRKELSFLHEDAEAFVDVFSFRAEDDLDRTEEIIKQLLEKIIGISQESAIKNCLQKVLSELRIWSTSRRKKQEIKKEDVYRVLCSANADIPQYELLPEKPIFPSRIRFADKFIAQIKSTSKNVIFLQGLPGAGKTNFVSYLAQRDDSVVDFRYYTYLPVDRKSASYSDDEGFYLGSMLWKSILVQLQEKFCEMGILSEVGFPIAYQYLSVSDMRDYAIRFLPKYANIMGRMSCIFIDGIDHAARSLDSRNSFLLQLPKPEELGDNIKFILVGQPVNDKYPNWLVKNEQIDYIWMSPLEQDDILEMLRVQSIETTGLDVTSLANTIISVVGNNALNVMFAVMELKHNVSGSFELLQKQLTERCLNGQIDKYYEWIINSIEKNALFYKIEALFATLSKKTKLADIVAVCDCCEEDAAFTISRLYPLIVNDENGYYAFHNDVRLHFQNEIKACSQFDIIVETFYERICSSSNLNRYKYDVLFNLVFLSRNYKKMFELVDINYVMQAVMYDITFDVLTKQLWNLFRIVTENKEKYLIKICSISLVLSQFANCIRYYEKESIYIEEDMPSRKTKSEMYILDTRKDFPQIIEDIYTLSRNGMKVRSENLYCEYFDSIEQRDLLRERIEKDTLYKYGYILRALNKRLIEENIQEDYLFELVDGWFDAGTQFYDEEGVRATFSLSKIYISCLQKYCERLLTHGGVDVNTYIFLTNILLHATTPISVIVELGTYGIFEDYPIDKIIDYISHHFDCILSDDTYAFDYERMLGFFKAWFCVYQTMGKKNVEDTYSRLLEKIRIKTESRGYKPAMAQMVMAENVFNMFYDSNGKSELNQDTVLLFIYFEDKFGLGSCNDCDGFRVVAFLRKVFVNWSKNNPFSDNVRKVCDAICQCLKWEKTRYRPEFNQLFLDSNAKDKFNEVAEYWCGSAGKAWNQEYSDVEEYCKTICDTLIQFGEEAEAELIMEQLKLKLFGYVGHKDYSLIELLEYYKHVPKDKIHDLKEGLRILEISDIASEIGDNRTNCEIDMEVVRDAYRLGLEYLNALFEIKNHPKEMVYWRRNVLNVLFSNLDDLSDDSELIALYILTNSWINARFEVDKQYGYLDTLKQYNNMVVNKIRNCELRSDISALGNVDCFAENNMVSPTITYDHRDILSLLEGDGYSERFENAILLKIREKSGGILDLILKLKERIPNDKLTLFADRCVVSFIINEGAYGFLYTGIRDVMYTYYSSFSENGWNTILQSIGERFSSMDIDSLCGLGTDLGIYTLGFLLAHAPERIPEAFEALCLAHENLITANGRVLETRYEPLLNRSIHTMSDFVRFQIGDKRLREFTTSLPHFSEKQSMNEFW